MTTKSLMFLIGWLLVMWGIIVRGMQLNSQTVTPVANKTWQWADVAYEVVKVGHNWRSLQPEKIVLQAGKSYDIQVTPQSNGIWCMFSATVPTLNRETYQITANETFSIKVVNARPGKYPVVCTSMGMSQGEIIVNG